MVYLFILLDILIKDSHFVEFSIEQNVLSAYYMSGTVQGTGIISFKKNQKSVLKNIFGLVCNSGQTKIYTHPLPPLGIFG